MHFCYLLIRLYLHDKTLKVLDAKKYLDAVSTAPLKWNVFWHQKVSRCLRENNKNE